MYMLKLVYEYIKDWVQEYGLICVAALVLLLYIQYLNDPLVEWTMQVLFGE